MSGISDSLATLLAAIGGVGTALDTGLGDLDTDISTEATDREQGDTTEQTRAEGVESTLQTNINTETTTREGDEATMNSAISALQTAVAGKANETDVTNLQTALNTAIAELTGTGALQTNGWVKLPVQVAGVWKTWILQWGSISIPTGDGDAVTFPTAYPNAPFVTVATDQGNGVNGCAAVGDTKTGFSAYGRPAGNGTTYASTSYGWMSIGW